MNNGASLGAEIVEFIDTMRREGVDGEALHLSVMVRFFNDVPGKCVYCGKPFVTGRKTGNRTTRLYCSNAHRVAAQRAPVSTLPRCEP